MILKKLIYLILWIFFYAVVLGFSATATPASSDIAVVVNIENSVQELTPKQISDIFLGRRRTFPSGDPVLVLERERNSPLRKNFFQSLNGMTLKRLNAYWARLQFSGEVQPPPVLPDNESLLQTIRDNPDAIGYVDATYVDDSVKIVLYLRKP